MKGPSITLLRLPYSVTCELVFEYEKLFQVQLESMEMCSNGEGRMEQPETGDASSWGNTELVLGCEEIDSAVSVILLSG